jgi:hypothetical protein
MLMEMEEVTSEWFTAKIPADDGWLTTSLHLSSSFCRTIHTSSRCHTITFTPSAIAYYLNCQKKKLNNEGKLYAALPQRASRHRRWGLRLRAFNQTPKTHYGLSCMGISDSRKGKLYDLPFSGTIPCVDCKSCWCKEKYVRSTHFVVDFS